MVDYSVVLQGPHVVQLLLAHILVWGKSQDSVRIVTEALRFVEGQKLEVSALIVLQSDLELSERSFLLLVSLERLDASVVLPDESLELGRSIGQLRGSLRENLVRVRLVHVIGLSLASLIKLVPLNE